MKREFEEPNTALITIHRVLAAALAVAAAFIIAGTVYAMLTDRPTPRVAAVNADAAAAVDAAAKTPADEAIPISAANASPAYFSGIGRVRVSLAGEKTAVLVVSVIFPYDRSDIAFSEELAATTRKFRETTLEYFSKYSASELKTMDEDTLKNDLKKRFNALLRLGRIDALYFDDYFLID